jgi:hypothetical protein
MELQRSYLLSDISINKKFAKVIFYLCVYTHIYMHTYIIHTHIHIHIYNACIYAYMHTTYTRNIRT